MYVYNAALYCDNCGKTIKAELDAKIESGELAKDVWLDDSDKYPQYYIEDNSETDCPSHCYNGPHCENAIEIITADNTRIKIGALIEESLTSDGYKYVQSQAIEDLNQHQAIGEIVQLWMDTFNVPLPAEYTLNIKTPEHEKITIKVTQAIDLLYWDDLTSEEKHELDYIEDPDERGMNFFRFQDGIYDLCDIMHIEPSEKMAPNYFPNVLSRLGFDGFNSDSFFSGVAVKQNDDRTVTAALVMV